MIIYLPIENEAYIHPETIPLGALRKYLFNLHAKRKLYERSVHALGEYIYNNDISGPKAIQTQTHMYKEDGTYVRTCTIRFCNKTENTIQVFRKYSFMQGI
jgi:hypothetical protein